MEGDADKLKTLIYYYSKFMRETIKSVQKPLKNATRLFIENFLHLL